MLVTIDVSHNRPKGDEFYLHPSVFSWTGFQGKKQTYFSFRSMHQLKHAVGRFDPVLGSQSHPDAFILFDRRGNLC